MEELVAVIKGNIADFKSKMSEVSSTLKSTQESFKKVGKSATKYLTLPITIAGGAAFKMASDFNESLNKVDVAFKGSSEEVKDWANTTLKSFGIASGTALDMAALYGDMATSMGFTTKEAAKMSMEMVGLAGDLASFKNISIDIANTALKSVFTGETESLKTLGIVMTEDNIKAYLLSQGIKDNYDKMDQAAKVAIRYKYVLSQTVNAQGDFARTGGGAANQMRIFQENMKELGVTFGQVLLPAITDIIKKVNSWLESIRGLSPETKKLIVVLGLVAAAIGPLSLAISGILSAVPILVAGGTAIASAWLPITAIIVGVTAAIEVFNAVADKTGKYINQLTGKPLEDLEKKKKIIDDFFTAGKMPSGAPVLSNLRKQQAEELIKYLGIEKGSFKDAEKALFEYSKALDEVIPNALEDEITASILAKKSLEEVTKKTKQDVITPKVRIEQEVPELIKPIDKAVIPNLISVYTSLDGINSIIPKTIEFWEQFSDTVSTRTTVAFDKFGNKLSEMKQTVIDVNAEIESLIEQGVYGLADAIGRAIGGGGDFGLDSILVMFADWAQKLGGILIAAGIAIEGFKKQALSNPYGVVILGAALVAAGAAVKAAVENNPTTKSGSYASSSGGGSSTFELYGTRALNAQGMKIQVNGEIKASGRELKVVLDNEAKRSSL